MAGLTPAAAPTPSSSCTSALRLLAAVLGGKVKLVKAADGASLVLTVGSGFRLG